MAKLTTEEILKLCREQGAFGSGGSSAPAESAPEPAAEEALAVAEEAVEASEEPAAKPAPAPAGPGGALAAIRAQGAAGSAKKPVAASASAAKPAGGAAPKGTADILAAIRGGGGDAAAAPAKKKVAATAAPTGDMPPVSEMLAQMKAGKKPAQVKARKKPAQEEAVASAKPTLKIPTRPAPKAPEKVSRRSVLLELVASPFALAWTVLAATAGAWVLMLARFMFPNMIVEPPTTFKIGPPSDFPLGTVSTKYTAANGIWIVHTDQYKGQDLIYILASVCTHLGCTPSWLEGEQKFKCPCHGSGFYINGINFEGPAPRPLERVGVALSPDGMLEVDKAVKFQEEKGQWEDAKSFVDGSIA